MDGKAVHNGFLDYKETVLVRFIFLYKQSKKGYTVNSYYKEWRAIC